MLAVLLALAWVVVTVWPGGSDDPRPTAAPTASTSADTEPSPEPAPTSEPATDVSVSLASSGTPCDPEQVRITPSVPREQRAGEAVRVDLLVSTTATEACTLEPGDAELVAVVSSGKTAVWDSSVCRTGLLDTAVALTPGWATSVETRWTGRGSGRTCSDDEGFAPGGDYRLRIGTLGGEPGSTGFALDKAAPKKKPEDEKKSEDEKKQDEKQQDEDAEGEDAG